MATIKPFKALRPKTEFYKKIASVPYDVINSSEAKQMAKGNDLSFLHIVRPEIDLEDNIDIYSEKVYNKAKENFKKLKPYLLRENSDSLYIYSQQMGDHIQSGIVGLASVDEYDNDTIKKHEKTRKQKEDDRTKHIMTLKAHSGPVFLTYRKNNIISNITEKIQRTNQPIYSYTSTDNVIHTVWKIEDQNLINQIKSEFKSIKYLYVADGHHRSASASRARKEMQNQNPNHNGNESYNFFLSVFFPDEELKIMAYNRVVKSLNNNDTESFLSLIQENFIIEKTEIKNPPGPKQFCMYLENKWYLLKTKPHIIFEDDPVKNLDVSILQDNLLSPILGIKDPRTSNEIDFIGGIRGTSELEKLVNSNSYKVAFSLYPCSIKQLLQIADNNLAMPPKSTWFEPKLQSGLLINTFDNDN